MNDTSKKMEAVFDRAFRLLEEGKSPREIRGAFGENNREAEEALMVFGFLKKSRQEIRLSEDAFQKTIAEIEKRKNVTENELSRSTYRGKNKAGRSSMLNNLIQNLHIMDSKWKIALPVFAVLLIAVVIGLGRVDRGVQKQAGNTSSPDKKISVEDKELQVATNEVKTELPNASGDVDSTVDAILASVTAEQSVLDDESSDLALLTEDEAEINNLSQLYDENEF